MIFSGKQGKYRLPKGSTSGSSEFDKFIEERTRLSIGSYSNCMGSALHIVGEVEDCSPFYGEHENILRKLRPADSAQVGFLVGWHDAKHKETYHLGVVTNVDPLAITNMHEWNGPLITDEPLMSVDERYGHAVVTGRKIKYFIPRKLEKLLSR